MSAFTPQMETALAADTPLIFGAIKIELPSHTIRLLDGAGVVAFNSETFTGRDDVFGTLEAIDVLSDGVGDEAPALRITLSPSNDAAAATLADPTMQGSAVSLWLGAVDRSTGAVIPDPLLLFFGEVDQPTLTVGKSVRTIEYECVSSFERLFDVDEGMRLADSFHKMVWPGETGLAHVTGITKKIYWGSLGPTSSMTVGSSNSGGAFGGGGGLVRNQ